MDRFNSNEQESKGTRRSFLRTAATAGTVGVVGAVGLWPSEALATEANPLLLARFFRDVQKHENDHVAYLVRALGSAARPKPTFKGLTMTRYLDFFKTTRVLENTGTGAYNGAAPFIDDNAKLAAAASIALIEARHSAYINGVLDKHVTTNVFGTEQSFEQALTQDQVIKLASPFIDSLNNGPALAFDTTKRTPENDIAILNFALALEFLEQEFYNINVPKFFPGRFGQIP